MRRSLMSFTALAIPALLACTSGPASPAAPSGVEVTPSPAHSRLTAGVQSGAVTAARATPDLDRVRVTWGQVAGGFVQPTQVTSAKDGTPRLFVVEEGGRIKAVSHGHVVKRTYLDLHKRVNTSGEGGLLSVAFSPRFRKNHKLYVAYARRHGGDLVIASLRAHSAGASRVRAATLRTLLVVEHSQYDNHYGGQLAFGPDGDLYIGTGDGGGGGDPFNSAGDRDSLRGKILRIDVRGSCGHNRYCVPSNNPYVGKPGRNEIWLLGLRNPWRFSFDNATRSLWIGDVGQDATEEVDHIAAHPKRRNLGWSCREGNHIYNASRCHANVKYQAPVATVPHPQGEAVTGGFVYRGQKYRGLLHGVYIFADYVTTRVWVYAQGQGKRLQPRRLGPSMYQGATSFGVSDSNEVYAVTYNGVLWRMRASRP